MVSEDLGTKGSTAILSAELTGQKWLVNVQKAANK